MQKTWSWPTLREVDPEVADIIAAENRRQHSKIRLIPSENYASQAVLEGTGSVLTNKYSEGYAGRRYYEGQQQIDRLEEICVERAKDLFGAEHVNVQPYSGSPANQAVYVALADPGDVVMGLALANCETWLGPFGPAATFKLERSRLIG